MELSRNIHHQPDASSQPKPVDLSETLVVAFALGEQTFALEIETVVQVMPMLKLTPMPESKDIIEGVVNFHGQIVPVLNARRILAWPVLPPQLNTPLLIIHANQRLMGLIVDDVKDVVRLPADTITPPDQVLPEGMKSAAILKGVAFFDRESILLIDADHLLRPIEIHALNRAIEAMAVSKDGHRRPRQRRKNLSAALADQMVTLASDLPPVDGQSPIASRAEPTDPEG